MEAWRGRRLALMRLTYGLLWLFGPRSFVAGMVADKMIASTARPNRSEMVTTVASALRRCNKRGLLRAARSAMFERVDLLHVLPEIHVPVLFLAGSDDALLPVDEARRQAARIPVCRFAVIPRSAHQSALESPAEVLPLVRGAIEEWLHLERSHG